MLYTNLRDATGQPVSIRCDNGKIAEIGPALPCTPDVDGGGRLLMPAFVEPHVHLDKTLYGEPWMATSAGPALRDYIDNERRVLAAQTTPISVRAGRLLERMLAYGTTAIRSHIDVAPTSASDMFRRCWSCARSGVTGSTCSSWPFPRPGFSAVRAPPT